VNTSLAANDVPGMWFLFDRDRVVLHTGKVELGQGIGISLKQIASDELTIPVERINLVSGDTSRTPNEMWTSASISIEVGGGAVRTVARELRNRFQSIAVKRFNGKPVHLEDGYFRADDDNRVFSFGDLAGEVDLHAPVRSTIAEVEESQFRAVGQSVRREDLEGKFTRGGFIHDIELPGMLHARVVLPPRPTARLAEFDESAVSALPGVVNVVRDGRFVGIVAEREEFAIAAQEVAERIAIWEGGQLPPYCKTTQLLADLDAESMPVVDGPCVENGHHLRFSRPFIAHASVGLVCALAEQRNGVLTIWSQSQGVFPLRDAIARTLNMSFDEVRVIHAHGAGCYGHNGADDVALEAALLARATGRPVRLLWTRAQELSASPAGPAMQVDLTASLGDDGRVNGWDHRIKGFTHLTRPGWGEGVNLVDAWGLSKPQEPSSLADPGQVPFGGAGCRNAPPIYDVPARVDYALIRDRKFRTSALRALGAHLNVFAIEAMMDDLAVQAGMDPVEFRLAHLSDERGRAVIDAVTKMAGWPPPVSDGSIGRGLGFARYKNSSAYCAVVLDVDLRAGIRVSKAWAAVDAGLVINPDGLVNQIEGGIIQAISWTLKEQLRWDENGFTVRGWDDYEVLRFDEVPSLEVQLLGTRADPPLGVGECATGPTAAAIGNALKQALGMRLVEMPLTYENITAALG
jgi:CO/xanthine dehydrogenase Mo-binding subunit